MRKLHTATAVVALILLAACGGGSSTETPEPTKTSVAPPRDFSIEELKAALPGKDHVPDSLQLRYVCPSDSPFCTTMEEGDAVSADIELIPAGADSPAEIEVAASDRLIADAAEVTAWRHESADLATKSAQGIADSAQKFEGSYDVKQAKDGKYIVPAEKGTGTVKKLSLDGWKGVIGTRTGSFSVDDESMQRQYTILRVASGNTTVSVSVMAEDKERSADYSDKLARKLLADYLKRLG